MGISWAPNATASEVALWRHALRTAIDEIEQTMQLKINALEHAGKRKID